MGFQSVDPKDEGKVAYSEVERIGGKLIPIPGSQLPGYITHLTCSFFPSHRASPPLGQYQIMQLGSP